MRKSGWASAAGLVSVALLLTACGGSSSSAASGSTASGNAQSTGSPNSSASNSQPVAGSSGNSMTPPPKGAVYMSVQKAGQNGKSIGFVLSEAAGQVVYTYVGDRAGKAPTCTGSCASVWPPLKGVPLMSPADNIPGKFSTIDGVITYNGLPLYTFKGATTHLAHASGQWKVVKMSESDVLGA